MKNKFDKNKFSEIITKIANSNGGQQEYCAKYNLSRSSISKYMNRRFDVPPKPATLKRIAESSNGLVLYSELMNICGYIEGEKKENKNEFESLESLKKYLENEKKKENSRNYFITLQCSKENVQHLLYRIYDFFEYNNEKTVIEPIKEKMEYERELYEKMLDLIYNELSLFLGRDYHEYEKELYELHEEYIKNQGGKIENKKNNI